MNNDRWQERRNSGRPASSQQPAAAAAVGLRPNCDTSNSKSVDFVFEVSPFGNIAVSTENSLEVSRITPPQARVDLCVMRTRKLRAQI